MTEFACQWCRSTRIRLHGWRNGRRRLRCNQCGRNSTQADAHAPLPPPAQVKADLAAAGHQAEVEYWRKLYREAIRARAFEDALLHILTTCVRAIEPLPPHKYKPSPALAKGKHAAVALLSDMHVGEVVDPSQTGGLGQYNMQICSRRLGLWTQKILELVDLRRSRLQIGELVIPGLGDMVSGVIHSELAETNATNMIGQVSRGAYMLSQATVSLAEHFRDIRILGVPGNHGRMTRKPPAKEQYVSWDYLFYQMWAMFCRRQTNVHFSIGKSFYNLFDVQGLTFLAMHGDSVKGWAGLPYYGIERAVMKMRQMLDLKRQRFDMVLMGHFHEAVDTERYIINSSFVGCNEFSASKLHAGGEPSQTMFYVHPEHRIVGTERLYLASADDQPRYAIPDALPDVWAEVSL